MSNTFLLKQFSKNPWVMIGGKAQAASALAAAPAPASTPASTQAELTEAKELDQEKSQLTQELDGDDIVDEEPIDSDFLNRRLGLGDQEEEKEFLKHLEDTTGVGQDFSADEPGVDGKQLEGPKNKGK